MVGSSSEYSYFCPDKKVWEETGYFKDKDKQAEQEDLIMAKRTSEDIQREIEQLKNRKKEVLAQEKNRARKLRTKRVIERGAILEQYIEDAEHYTNDEVQEIVRYALNTPYAREYIRKLRATSGLY